MSSQFNSSPYWSIFHVFSSCPILALLKVLTICQEMNTHFLTWICQLVLPSVQKGINSFFNQTHSKRPFNFFQNKNSLSDSVGSIFGWFLLKIWHKISLIAKWLLSKQSLWSVWASSCIVNTIFISNSILKEQSDPRLVLSDTEAELGATQHKQRVKADDDVTWEWGQLPQVSLFFIWCYYLYKSIINCKITMLIHSWLYLT